MFQNPYFKEQVPVIQSPQARQSSVTEVLNKYRQSSVRQSTYENVLGSVNESLNSMDQSIGQSEQQQLFSNPMPIKYDNTYKKESSARMTFGDGVMQKQLTEADLYDDMSHLKDKVTNMLQKYSVQLKSQENKKQIQNQLQLDANVVAQEYSQIIEKFNNPDLSAISVADSIMPQKKEQELQQMFGLVEEFLIKFKNLSQTQQNQSQLLKSKIKVIDQQSQQQFQQQPKQQPYTSPLKTSPPSVAQPRYSMQQSSDRQITFNSPAMSTHSSQAVKTKAQSQLGYRFTEQPQIQTYTQETQQPLDMTILPQIPKMDDSFYDHKTVNIARINSKLTQLKVKLELQLQQENMPYTKRILVDMIQNLNDIIGSQDLQLVKTIVYRIEKSIQQLPQSSEGSMQLYKYLNKAIMHSKSKQDIYSNRASMPVAMNYRASEVFTSPQKLSPQKVSPQKTTTTMGSVWVSNDQDFRPSLVNQRYSEMRPSEQQSLKRVFFDSALSMKNQLPQNHPGRELMVSDLYDEYLSNGQGDVQVFIRKRLCV